MIRRANNDEQDAQRLPSAHLLRHFQRLLPRSVVGVLLEMKRRILARQFPRDASFTQSLEDRQATASMSVIVAIHDAPIVTARCLVSLEQYAPESEVILVDDGSALPETAEVIRRFSQRNHWKTVRHETPLGHSEACRAGARLATRPFLCLLNSDTVVTPWCWRRIVQTFDQHPEVGAAGPSTTMTGNPQALPLPEFLSPYWNDSQICAFAQRLLRQPPEPAVTDIPWVAGCAFFIRCALWERLGGFDPHLPDYGNEIELCGRVLKAGYRLVWVQDAFIHHFGRQSYRGALGDEGIRSRILAAENYTRQKQGSSPARS